MSSRTLARWVSDILHKAGIHAKTFKSDSLRSASTSNAFSGGLPLTKISKAAGWKNVKTFGKFYNKPVIDNNFGNFLLNLYLYILYAENKCFMIYVILYIYHFWLWSLVWILIRGRGRGLELTNREIISKIKLVKWRLIEIILPWEIPPPWYVFMRPPRPTQCDIPIEKRDVFKEGSADDWPISHEYLSGWGNLSRKNNSNQMPLR